MPYIKQENRKKWEPIIAQIKEILLNEKIGNIDGELNYLITSILKFTYKDSYSRYNSAIGLLECIKQEFYRQDVSPYEDKKAGENGYV